MRGEDASYSSNEPVRSPVRSVAVRGRGQDPPMVLKRKDLPPGVLEATRDPYGRLVVLSRAAMDHIVRRHRELDGCELAITTAIENAAFCCEGNAENREVLVRPEPRSRSVACSCRGVRCFSPDHPKTP